MEKSFLAIDAGLRSLAQEVETGCAGPFERIEQARLYHSERMLAAFIENKISDMHFAGTTGYGYDDAGRDALERVTAALFCAPDALMRHNFMSGTHALCVALLGVLRPGDEMVCITGTPYDTLHGVLGIGHKGDGQGNFNDLGIRYCEVALTPEGKIDLPAAAKAAKGAKAVYIQRSRGYALRASVRVSELREAILAVKKANPSVLVIVDNCYCEFVECDEPCAAGADLIAGSLIKNPGGGIAQTGGYIAGRKELVELCGYRLSAPGVGREIGCTLGQTRNMLMGLFFAPGVTADAVKTAVFAAALFEKLGFAADPLFDAPRADIIQSLRLMTPENLCAFCEGIQAGAPVDSFVTPVAAPMPGYDSQVIMAAGAFTMGASVELSADAPLRPPYAVFMQGGLTYPTARLGVLLAAQRMRDRGLIGSL